MNEKKTNVIQFKKTLDEISAYANKKCDEGDYSAALYALYFYTKRKIAAETLTRIWRIYIPKWGFTISR